MTRDTGTGTERSQAPDEWDRNENIFGDEYDVELEPADTSGGKILTSTGSDGEVYAGKTVRDAFENAAQAPTQAWWIGHDFSPKGLRKRLGGIPSSDYFTHTFASGDTGSGKTTVLNNSLTQIAYAGWGFCFVDPGGDAIKDLLRMLPEYRLDDVVFVQPPTGEYDRVVATNLLEVPRFDGEPEARYDARVSRVVEENVGVLGGNQDMFARMEGVLKPLMQTMIEADESYTVMSIEKFLLDEELQAEFSEHIEDIPLREWNDRVADLDQDEKEPLIRRINDWVLNKNARRAISHSESSVSIAEAVEDGKIILVDTQKSQVGKDVSKAIGSAIVTRIWATMQAKANEVSSVNERQPFFLAIDEMNDALTPNADVSDMLENARKFRLGLILATQYAKQLEENGWMESVLAQCSSLITMEVGDDDSAAEIASQLKDIDMEELEQLDEHEAYLNISTDSGTTVPALMHTFAPYPPLRSETAVERIIQRSLDKYGVDPDAGVKYDATTIEQVVRGEGTINTGTADIETAEMLNAIDAVELFAGATTSDEYVLLSDVAEEMQNRTDQELSTRQLEKAVVQLPESFIDTKTAANGDMLVTLTPTGQETARDAGTSDSASAGGAKHQSLVQETRNLFTRLRCDVEIPDQLRDASAPDGIAELPVAREPGVDDLAGMDGYDTEFLDKPPGEWTASEIQRFHEVTEQYQDELETVLAEYHDELPRVSGGRDMYLEAESTTPSSPALTLRNLRKAVNTDHRCVFTVRDEDVKRTVTRALMSPPEFCNSDSDAGRVLYTGEQNFTVQDGDQEWVALRDASAARTKWIDVNSDASTTGDWGVEDTHQYALETTSGDEVMRVTAKNIDEASLQKGAAEAWGGFDEDDRVHRVFEVGADGRVSQRVYDTKDEFKEDWSKITRPFVPEVMFDRRPTRDDWCVLVIPGDTDGDAGYDTPTLVTYDENGSESEFVIEFDTWGTGSDDRGAVVTGDGEDGPDTPTGSDSDTDTEGTGEVGAVGDVDIPDYSDSVSGDADTVDAAVESDGDGEDNADADTSDRDDGGNDGEGEGSDSESLVELDFDGVDIDGAETPSENTDTGQDTDDDRDELNTGDVSGDDRGGENEEDIVGESSESNGVIVPETSDSDDDDDEDNPDGEDESGSDHDDGVMNVVDNDDDGIDLGELDFSGIADSIDDEEEDGDETTTTRTPSDSWASDDDGEDEGDVDDEEDGEDEDEWLF